MNHIVWDQNHQQKWNAVLWNLVQWLMDMKNHILGETKKINLKAVIFNILYVNYIFSEMLSKLVYLNLVKHMFGGNKVTQVAVLHV